MGRSDSEQCNAKRSSRRRLLPLVLAVFALVPLLVASDSGAQSSDPPRPFLIGGGSADGVRVALDIPGFLVVETVEVSAPSAQVSLDSGGNVNAFAGLPYPGEVAANVGSVLSVLLGISFPVTPPGYVHADAASGSNKTMDPTGTYELSAVAEPARAVGLASLDPGRGSISSGIRAESTITYGEDGSMRVHSESVMSGLDLGGIVRIASIRAHSTTIFEPGADAPESDTDFAIEAIKIAGVTVGIGPDGLRLAGTTIPLPLGDLQKTLNGLLAGAGVEIKTFDSVEFEGGARSKGIEISITQELPVDGSPTATVTYRFGGASSFITVAPAPEPIVAPATPAPTTTAAPPPPSTSAAVVATPTPAVTSAPTTPVPTTEPAATQLQQAAPVKTIMAARDLSGLLRIPYLALIFGAAAASLGSIVWGSKGVRATWLRR